MTTRVVHCKKEPFDIYIGRPGPWGNPWSSNGKDEYRPLVIARYAQWVKFSDNEKALWVRSHVHELKDKTLGCWCKPKACHGDVLARIADEV